MNIDKIDAVEVQERLAWSSAGPGYCDTWLMVNAGDLSFKASEQYPVSAMANIGHQLLQEIAAYRPGFEWKASPAEIVGALIEEMHLKSAAPSGAASAATIDVQAERSRQGYGEGVTNDADDKYLHGELRAAACSYALAHKIQPGTLPAIWPWSSNWWKPSTERRNLIKAGALILAEIERIDRAAIATSKAVK